MNICETLKKISALVIALIAATTLNLTLAESGGGMGGTIIVDNTPPSGFELISPRDNKTISDPTPILTWENSSDNESGIDHYEVWLGSSNVENTPAENTSYKTSSLNPNNYTWHIVAVNGVGYENQSENVFDFTVEEDNIPPEKPTDVTATVENSSQINLIWNDNAENNLNHYSIYRDNTDNFSTDANTFVENVKVSEFSDTGLQSITTYYYKIKAVDSRGNESMASSEENATTLVKTGDFNGDRKVDIVDALLVIRYDVGLDPSPFYDNGAYVNCDNNVNIVDALLIAHYAAGVIDNFECG